VNNNFLLSVAIKHQETTSLTHRQLTAVGFPRKKMSFGQLTAAEQGISTVNCRQLSFSAISKVETTMFNQFIIKLAHLPVRYVKGCKYFAPNTSCG